jgi:hypothetical protein
MSGVVMAGPSSQPFAVPLDLQMPAPQVQFNSSVGEPALGPRNARSTQQSVALLLEASQDGTTGAVPFSGTVEWSKGSDEMGQPTLIGKANIPARNLRLSVLIRNNSDLKLPASQIIAIDFTVNDSFIGGSISGLPGVLPKNEELVQGTPLVGASARVVGNSFLFALSSSLADEATNKDLLTSRKWMDLAIIYATGKKAIITLERTTGREPYLTRYLPLGRATTPHPAFRHLLPADRCPPLRSTPTRRPAMAALTEP